MAEKRVFFQDFIFEDLPVDEYDNPAVTIDEIFDITTSEIIRVSLDRLLRMNKKQEWDDLYSRISGCVAVIIDDLQLLNDEIRPYKEFYLKSYYYNLSKYAKKCFVLR